MPEQTPGGLLMLGREYPCIAQVLAIGPGIVRRKDGRLVRPPDIADGTLAVNDHVYFLKQAFRDPSKTLDNDLMLLSFDDLLLVIKDLGA